MTGVLTVRILSRRLSIVPEAATRRRAIRTSWHVVIVERAIASSRYVPRRHRITTNLPSAATTAGMITAAIISPQREVVASDTV